MKVIAQSDWVIDVGPGAGDEGGKIVAQGISLDIKEITKSLTAKYLKQYLRSGWPDPCFLKSEVVL